MEQEIKKNMPKKIHTGLGKGLGALLPSIEFRDKGFKVNPSEDEEKIGNLPLIEISKIHRNRYQPRKDFDPQSLEDLTNSIKEHGIIQPITVRREINGYELISGERRYRAAISAGLLKIPAYIIDVDEGYESLELALIENIQRKDLNPIEIANGYQRLIEECNYTQDEVAAKMGKDRSTISNFLRLLNLPEKIQESLRSDQITMGHARALLGLKTSKRINHVWNELINNELNVRATEKLVREIENGTIHLEVEGFPKKPEAIKQTKEKSKIDAELLMILEDIEDKLRHIFGTKVKIKTKSEESGSIEMEFYSKDDLERLLEIIYKMKE